MPRRATFRPDFVNLHYITGAIDRTVLDLREIKRNAKDPKEVQQKIKALLNIKSQVTKECPQNFFKPFALK